MSIINPDALERDVAQARADELAARLRADGWEVEIRESIRSRFEVVARVPFRHEIKPFDRGEE